MILMMGMLVLNDNPSDKGSDKNVLISPYYISTLFIIHVVRKDNLISCREHYYWYKYIEPLEFKGSVQMQLKTIMSDFIL